LRVVEYECLSQKKKKDCDAGHNVVYIGFLKKEEV